MNIFFSSTKEHRKLVCDTIFEEHDKQLLEDTIQKYSAAASKKDPEAPISASSLQLHWIYWCDFVRNDLSWKAIWATQWAQTVPQADIST